MRFTNIIGMISVTLNLHQVIATGTKGRFNCQKAKEATEKVVRSVVYPAAVDIVVNGNLPDEFASNVKGRVNPVGAFTDQESTIEYFYALGIGDAPINGGVPSPDRRVLLDVDIQFMSCDKKQKKVIWSAVFKSGFVKDAENGVTMLDGKFLPATSIFSFNKEGKICSYDQNINRLGIFTAEVNGLDQDPINTATNAPGPLAQAQIQDLGITQTCHGIQSVCQGSNQQYGSQEDCETFLQELRYGGWDNADQNTVVCRQLHLLLAPIRPNIHCPHVGKDGGGKCTDKTLQDLYQTDYLSCSASESDEDEKLISGLWHGFLVPAQDGPLTPVGSLPITAAEALSLGWKHDGFPMNPGFGYLWIKSGEDDSFPFSLYFPSKYGDKAARVSGLKVIGPEVKTTGGQMIPVPGSTSIGNGLVAYDTKFGLDGDSLEVGTLAIPTTATEAENQGWKEHSCFEPMGGSHYIKNEWAEQGTQWPFITPLYNKYGDDKIKTIAFVFGTDGIKREEFDLGGIDLPVGLLAVCAFTHCGEPSCFASPQTVGPLTTLHLYFSDPSPTFSGLAYPVATCQRGAASPCFLKGCSCCGSPDNTIEELTQHCQQLP